MADTPQKNHDFLENLLKFDYIYQQWLYYFDNDSKNGSLSAPIQTLVDLMFKEAGFESDQAAQTDFKRLWEYYDLVREGVKNSENYTDMADVEVACARVDLRFGRIKDAEYHLIEAEKQYQPFANHSSAVTRWLHGIVLWNSPISEMQWKALTKWNDCCQKYDDFAHDPNTVQGGNKWYTDRIKEINQLLAEIKNRIVAAPDTPGPRFSWLRSNLQTAQQPASPPFSAYQPKTPDHPKPIDEQPVIVTFEKPTEEAPAPGETAKQVPEVVSPDSLSTSKAPDEAAQETPRSEQVPDTSHLTEPPPETAPPGNKAPEKQHSIPTPAPGHAGPQSSIHGYRLLKGAISAGRFETMGKNDSEIEGYALIEELNIDGTRYQVAGLRGRKTVSYSSARSAYVIKVKGDSMNDYPILDIDYVLIDPTLKPQTGDVVVTRVIEEQDDDPKCNLKYLESIGRDEIILSYRSTRYRDEKGNNRRFIITSKGNRSVDIIGVAIARFTPKINSPDFSYTENLNT